MLSLAPTGVPKGLGSTHSRTLTVATDWATVTGLQTMTSRHRRAGW
jgi:hypothetical protein